MNTATPDCPIAVVGMACRLPGAQNLDEFWRLVRSGSVSWGPLPEDRFDRQLYFDPKPGVLNKSYSDLAALLAYREVDRGICPISEEAIASHDLAHVTLCEVAAAACQHGGFHPAALPSANTGVYIGHAAASGLAADVIYSTYIAETAAYLKETAGFDQLAHGLGDQVIQELIAQVRRSNAKISPRGPFLGASMAAKLIAETFALNGPCVSLNAACASSSRAVVQAMRALRSGSVDMAVVGGASFFHSDTLVLFCQSRSVSANGSHPFSNAADGLVIGEGYVVVLLETLERAVANQHRILAVLPSVGASSDGRGKSLWAPRLEGQVKAMQRAYGSGVSAAQLQYIEAHATSTALGDVTEVSALTTILDGQLPPGAKLPIGSAKLNVGHTLEAAGLVGLAKTILALQHQVIPPAIDQRPLNPQIDWDSVPLYVPRQEVAWTAHHDGQPRRAGVNAFGIGGLNVHLVVDEYIAPTSPLVRGLNVPQQTRAGKSRDDHDIAIIGIGAVMPGALSRDAFWELLTSGRDPISQVPKERWDRQAFYRPGSQEPWTSPADQGAFIQGFEYDWRKHKIPPREIANASPLQFMILDAVDQAFHHAQYHAREFDRERVGVVVGTVFGGDCATHLVSGLRLPVFQEKLTLLLRQKGVPEDQIASISKSYADVLLKHMPAILDETGSFTASALASRITKSFNLMGTAVALDSGRASSMAALSCCVDELRSGATDMMVCVGGQHDMTVLLYEALKVTGRLATGQWHSPFDVQANGVLPGEGCGALLLKRLSDAKRDNDPIHGIIRGIGCAFDTSSSQSASVAVQRAMNDADLSPNDVAVLESTPVGHPAVDAATMEGLARAYSSDSAPRGKPLVVGSTTGQIGDTGGACGMAALLKAVMEIEDMRVPADQRLTQVSPYLTQHAEVMQVATQLSPFSAVRQDGRVVAAVHSGGQNEVNYHVLLERGTELKTNKPREKADPALAGQISHFDATVRRRDKLRQQANTQTARQPAPQSSEPGGNGSTSTSASSTAAPAQSAPAPVQRQVRPAQPAPAPAQPATNAATGNVADLPSATPAPSPVPATPTVPVAPPAASTPAAAEGLDAVELEKFLVNFVVEHTGYPSEIVELDADLEADLGIDSIKKAQLFGELGEYFDVEPSEDLSLDDFPTLRHVLEFLVRAQADIQSPSAPATSNPPAVPPTQSAAPVATSQAPGSPVAAAPVDNPSPVLMTPSADSSEAIEPTLNTATLDAEELEDFLVNFVVEHTGYPSEIVELDADLEADLGIDSIKKAQLFGELGEYFDVQPSEDLSLDDFPTLRHVLDYLIQVQGPSHTETPIVDTSYISSTTPSIAPTSPAAPPTAAPQPSASESTAAIDSQGLESFLVNFVVEHTGYPAEIVELDADLEADLGIDSIKKAQLFGELGEYFDVQPSEDLSLDDFPTLRHVLQFLVVAQSGTPPTAGSEQPLSSAAPESSSAPQIQPPSDVPRTAPPALPGATVPPPTATPAPEDATADVGATSRLDSKELEEFLVNFVVEHTGYPTEIVELDADLEADLGIDSIKKAQLFGELGEYFDVQPSEDLSLDDFPTLRHVLNFLLQAQNPS